MEAIILIGTDDTPGITLDANNQIFEISGRSIPEDPNKFFTPILDWLDSYAENPNPKTVFDFKFEYFNTSSSKLILDILIKLEKICDDGKDVLIKWHFSEDDEDMKKAGEKYADMVDIPFEHVKANE